MMNNIFPAGYVHRKEIENELGKNKQNVCVNIRYTLFALEPNRIKYDIK